MGKLQKKPVKKKVVKKKKKPKRGPKKKTYKLKYKHKVNQHYTINEIDHIADLLYEWFNNKEENKSSQIWLKDFCIEHFISQNRLSEFKEKSEYFEYIYSLCKDIQESKLVKIGMSKRANATMAIFALKNVSGWRDRTENINDNTNKNYDMNEMANDELKKKINEYEIIKHGNLK